MLDLLGGLVDRSLVLVEEQGRQTRYRLLETIRQYGAERLREAGEAPLLQDRHRDWYLALAEQAEPALKGPERKGWLERLEQEHDNLRAALAWCISEDGGAEGVGPRLGRQKAEGSPDSSRDARGSAEHDPRLPTADCPPGPGPGTHAQRGCASAPPSSDPEAGLRLAGALVGFWLLGDHHQEGREWLEKVLTRTVGAPAARRAKALDGAGTIAWALDDFPAARSWLEENLAIRRELGDKKEIAGALLRLGNVLCAQGEGPAGRALIEESLQAWRQLGNKQGIAQCLNNLGNTHLRFERVLARSYLEESLAIYQEMGDEERATFPLANLGELALIEGDHATARSRFERVLAIHRQSGSKYRIAGSLQDLGDLAHAQGDDETARALYEQSLAMWRVLGSKWPKASLLSRLGEVAHCQGDYRRAATLYEESLALFRKAGPDEGRAQLLGNLGHTALRQGDSRRAATLFLESLRLAQEQQDPRGLAGAFTGLAGVARIVGRARRAAVLLGAVKPLLGVEKRPLEPVDQREYDHHLAATRAALGEETFTAAWDEGRAMPREEAIAYALSQSL